MILLELDSLPIFCQIIACEFEQLLNNYRKLHWANFNQQINQFY
jgi:hypothetical protein